MDAHMDDESRDGVRDEDTTNEEVTDDGGEEFGKSFSIGTVTRVLPTFSEVSRQRSDQSDRPPGVEGSMTPCRLGQDNTIRISRSCERRSTTRDLESDPSFSLLDSEFIRAVPLSAALRMWGKHWKDSTGSDFTFNLSSPSCQIDVFFSHSWRTKWWMKVIGIIYYHNVVLAYIIAALLHAVLLGLALAGRELPLFSSGVGQAYVLEGDTLIPVSFNFRYVPGCLVFLLVLVSRQRCTLRPKKCFLDKMCINQTDPVKKDKGVRQLGALLRYSEQMMVLWQEEYLGRLWCVFELAAFSYMHGHKENALLFYPLKLPMLALSLFVFHLLACLSLSIVNPLTLHSDWHLQWLADNMHPALRFAYLWAVYFVMCFAGLYLLPSVLLWRFCKDYAHDADLIDHQLMDFKVARARCFLESDREYVISCIQRWFKSIHHFEEFVQNELRGIVLKRNGNNRHVPWSVGIVGSLSHLLIGSNTAVDCMLGGATVSASTTIVVTVFIAFCSDILALNLTLRLASSSFFQSVKHDSWVFRNLWGPMATASLFSAANGLGVAMLTANPPLWVVACILTLCMILNVLVASPDWFSCCRMPSIKTHPEPLEELS